jgi:excisionase family DNA binding protein
MLKVDRTTIYRMLKDGRLTGVKVGHRWRFDREELEAVLAGDQEMPPATQPYDLLPLDSLQTIQDVCADIAEMGALTIDIEGLPLTEISNPSRFCQMIFRTPDGWRDCVDSWRKLSRQVDEESGFATCHAGLQYARGQIKVNGRHSANLVAGHFYTTPPNSATISRRIRYLAKKYDLDETELAAAHAEIPVLDDFKRDKIERWLKKVSQTFSQISDERANMSDRLQRIAALSSVK